MDSSGNAIFGRISLAYAECQGALEVLATYGSKFIVYQHEGDDEVARTHIHFLIVSSTIGIEGLKKVFRRHYGGDTSGANKFWSWKESDDPAKNITYMSKGTLSYKTMKGFSPEEVETLRLAWVDHPPTPAPEKKYKDIDAIIESYGKLDAKIVTFDEIRSWVFAWYWRRDGEIPPATQYKRMAGTLYLRIAEVCSGMSLVDSMEVVKNLWY